MYFTCYSQFLRDFTPHETMEIAETACYLGASMSAFIARRLFLMRDKTFINKMFLWYFAVDAIMGTLFTFLLFRLERWGSNNNDEKKYQTFDYDRSEGEAVLQENCSLFLTVWTLWEPNRQLIIFAMMVMRQGVNQACIW